ncbi:hypothetical protein [Ramlibacter albus]|uniref:Uncharacterized protein n=1 Tax=Ramlibacter albus TaxID=2079448 RepID=A0A923M789_9BURK|nr:hypothetical protein [Ramlibacter albus]MBC5765270.1 hypothetical protein [Ramlibacter albus]
MNPRTLASVDSRAFTRDESLETCEELEQGGQARYCPTDLLADFALLMAGHGRCICTSMMLGDREYAMWQIACASAMDDAQLCAVAKRLFAYFDDPQHTGMPVLGTA